MKRKSKGQKAREEKVTQLEERAINSMLSDKWFNTLPVPVQIKLVSFIKEKVDMHLGVYEWLGYEKGMLDCMSCVIQVLGEDYWKKSPQKKWNKFVYDVSELMNSHLRDVVTWEEMRQYIKERTGLEIKEEVKVEGKDERPTPLALFGGKK